MKPAVFYGTPPSPRRIAAIRSNATQSRGQTGYDMADSNRLLEDWIIGPISNEVILRNQLCALRSRSRDLARNDDYFKGFLRLVASNVAGPMGMKMDLDIMNDDGRPDEVAIEAIKDSWREFSEPENFTTSGKFSRASFEQTLLRNLVVDGECLIEFVPNWSGNRFGFALRPWEVDYLDETKNETLRDGRRISMGVEYDRWDRPVQYWLRQFNPGDTQLGYQSSQKTAPMPASRFLHLFIPEYWEQSRGIPWPHAAGKRLHMLRGYEVAALEASRGGAAKHGYFEQLPDSTGQYVGDELEPTGNWLEIMEPGQKEVLPRGLKYNEIDPSFPQQTHGDFLKVMLRGVASSLGTAYPSLANDLEGVSWSSIRSGEIKERDSWKIIQAFLDVFCERPVFRMWLEISLMKGAILLPNGRPIGFSTQRFRKFNRPRFSGKRWQWVDPMKEQQANKLAIENRLTSRSQIIAESSQMDVEEVFRQIDRERELAISMGILLPEDVEMVSSADPEPDSSSPAEPDIDEEGQDEPTPKNEDGEPVPAGPAGGKPSGPALSPEQIKAQQIFGYHLENAVVRINEARERLGLPPVEKGDLTVPEFLAQLKLLNTPNQQSAAPPQGADPGQEGDGE